MKNPEAKAAKELYKQLRALPWDRLWQEEVPRFDKATPQERVARVSVVRAVGVVFSESGPASQKDEVCEWLRRLLQDPEEKIRRYAMTALPKIGAGQSEEAELLALLQKTTNDREKKFLGHSLDKIGGAATLEVLEQTHALSPQTEQKVRAAVLREQAPSAIRMDSVLTDFAGLRIHLRGRRGLERIVREEVEAQQKFRVESHAPGLVVISPTAPFSLGEIYALRCFGTVGIVLGGLGEESIEALASLITSPLARRIFKTFTDGAIRYRLDFMAKGHQRGAVREVASRAFAMCPEILNDARSAPWTVAVFPAGQGSSVELCPRLTPDPRFYYRQQDVPAASHPPLAACMARLAGPFENDVVWDPFCGSALELIERARLGGVRTLHGTDRSEAAIAIARENFAAAEMQSVPAQFTCCDFRDFEHFAGIRPGSVSLIITNPPMGKRVPIPNLRGLIEDLFAVATVALRPGGRFVFASPLRVVPADRSLRLESRQLVDFGGFDCSLEKYVKARLR